MSGRQPDDDVLIQRLQGGDEAAFDLLVGRYQDDVVRVAQLVTRDPASASDAAQEAFIRLWRNPGAYAGGSLKAWLFTVVRNLALNELRAGKRRQNRHDQHKRGKYDTAPPSDASNRDRLDEVREYMDTLPEAERTALVLFAVEGISQEEVAKIMGTSRAAVKQAVLSARRKLRDAFDAQP